MDFSSPSPIFHENSSQKIFSEEEKEWEAKEAFISKEQMDKAIMNYLLNAGYKEAAEKFSLESGIKIEKSMGDLENRISIKRLILKRDIMGAISHINHIYPELLENKKNLYFRLLQQQTIEMIRDKKLAEALEFAQKNLVEKVVEDINVLPEVEHTLTLLAFSDPLSSPYGYLLQPLHRQKVAMDVNLAILSYCNEDENTEISRLVQMIIWGQDELEASKSAYPKMSNIGEAVLDKTT